MTGPDVFRCPAYQCDLDELACAKRYVHAGKAPNLVRLYHCRACEVGKGNQAKHGATLNAVRGDGRFCPQWGKGASAQKTGQA